MKQQQKNIRKRNVLIVVTTMLLLALIFWAMGLHFQNDPGVSFGPFR